MKKINLFIGLLAISCLKLAAQGFINEIEQKDFIKLFNNKCVATLVSGEVIEGKLVSGTFLNGYLSNVGIKTDDEGRKKFNPDDIVELKVKADGMVKLAMLSESMGSLKEKRNTDYNEIINREYIIFEPGLRAKKKDKLRLMQLLNPGFDSKIKVFADPNANETRGVRLGGVKLTGGIEKSYLFVIDGEKAILVKKGSYRKNFEELYSSCQLMVDEFKGEKIKWDNVAGHVMVFDQLCK